MGDVFCGSKDGNLERLRDIDDLGNALYQRLTVSEGEFGEEILLNINSLEVGFHILLFQLSKHKVQHLHIAYMYT